MVTGQRFQEHTGNAFFARPVEKVAPDLVGCFLFTNFAGKRAGGMILEAEAYDENDVFSHCFVGASDTAKAASAQMFEEPGNVYLYWNGSAGLAINISCDRKGFGSAVLIRAVEPFDQSSAEIMRTYRLDVPWASKKLRGENFKAVLANGPGNTGDALGLDESDQKLSTRGQLSIFRDPFELYRRSEDCSPLPTARKGLDKMYERFVRTEPERATHEDTEAHRQRPWRWIHRRGGTL
ncbi:DNA-3-methyladenine glycosylase [Bradyrhizobium sp. CW4]|uniref:DNA-3-methyladenine glycosylase n=1 Tax=Bradyrhizobium sp. CW4 TaxID=2782687 RepID=UPI001FF896B6|nr:DNA-3-methyladenine glycosylase [Bradyrhizobium sp. CW4]MCK1417623.1 DNA-3-methyladenine glycosylase [Bradyrhizobium sp. CW4]